MISPLSIQGRLRNIAEKSGRTFQDILVSYAVERLLYRVSKSRYQGNLILKGGMLLYALFDSAFPRSTSDIDFLGIDVSNSSEAALAMFREIFAIPCDDAMMFDPNSIEVVPITEFKDLHGLNISGTAYLDKTRIAVKIDIGFGDAIFPGIVTLRYPTFLEMAVPMLNVSSKETIIAEKFHTIVSLGNLNSRYKDYYDIYLLQRNFDFEGEILAKALRETFNRRKTGLSDIVAFERIFSEDITRNKQWNGFLKKKVAAVDLPFISVIDELRVFLAPIADSNKQNRVFNASWNHLKKEWSSNASMQMIENEQSEMEGRRRQIESDSKLRFVELEKEWARYKYLILEHDPVVYQNIRRILNDKTEAPVGEFYRLVDKALENKVEIGISINAYQHVAGYFKNHWDASIKMKFGKMLEDYRNGMISRLDIKRYLREEAELHHIDYLTDSYFFDD